MTGPTRRRHAKLAALPGVCSLRRPVSPGNPEQFDLYYVRSGPRSAHPLLIIPGGPGVASVGLGNGLRRRAAAAGLDVIMIEHRGVGLSRRTDSGADLPPSALDMDQAVADVAAVLDHAGVDSAVVYGVSYGSYLAAGVGVCHPDRVHAMILDSPLLSRDDITAVRAAIRTLLWDGDHPETGALAPDVHRLVAAGVLAPVGGQIAGALYGLGGAPLLKRQLDLLLAGRMLLWRILNRIAKSTTRRVPYRNEPDLVSRIAFRELDYGPEPDGLPLDPAVAMREIGYEISAFEAEPYDLAAEMPKFNWPTVVVSGGRDLTTPPAIAEHVAALIPGAVLVSLPTMAHGALTTRERAALTIAAAVCRGDVAELGSQPAALDALPGSPAVRLATALVTAGAAVEAAAPGVLLRALTTKHCH
ncbi:MAG TPA: alpha/beta fold hydrolase [Mycobacterium sp.]|nr:alpha/beta fold hydrolase [Mycobacterium sp.]